jgi:SAM-dependent methyltransferase
MDWRIKAALHWATSLPAIGQPMYRLIQRRLLHTVPSTDIQFGLKVKEARRHLEAIYRFSYQPLSKSVFYEFGAGWGLEIPLIFWSLGVNAQILIDRQRLTDPQLVAHTVEQIRRLGASLELERVPFHPDLAACGISYFAPLDASRTSLAPASVDCITSTDTLEHVPAKDLGPLFRECRRLLRPGGIFSAAIDYSDHYQRRDGAINGLNYLKYSDAVWKFFNPPSHYQSRLRHCDYIALLAGSGFAVVQAAVEASIDQHLVCEDKLAKRFRSYSIKDLLPMRGQIVAIRKT